METAKPSNSPNRDYNSISPSAQSLLLMKGITSIPFARQAAELMLFPEKYDPDLTHKDPFFFARILHFENRYWSIDQLLADLSIKNILELSSGFSFRGLQMTQEHDAHYIDTDLPDLIAIKKKYTEALRPGTITGQLETTALNALDENQFNEVLSHFQDGALVIVNEGLLMYLNTEEKKKICSIIHRVLKQRGGYWITADIYIKRKASDPTDFKLNERERKFFEQHHIEENKFESFEDAETFFRSQGFVIDKMATPDHSKLSSLKYLQQYAQPGDFEGQRKSPRFQATWRMKAV